MSTCNSCHTTKNLFLVEIGVFKSVLCQSCFMLKALEKICDKLDIEYNEFRLFNTLKEVLNEKEKKDEVKNMKYQLSGIKNNHTFKIINKNGDVLLNGDLFLHTIEDASKVVNKIIELFEKEGLE